MHRRSHVDTHDPAGARRYVRGLATALALGLALAGLGVSTAGADFDYSTSNTLSLSPMDQGSCPSTSLCLVPDHFGQIWTSTNPTSGASATWAANAADAPNSVIDGVSCPTTTLCVAVDESGRVLTSANPTLGATATWATKAAIDAAATPALAGISCPSTTLCVAIDGSAGRLYTTTDPANGASATWTKALVPLAAGYRVACETTTLCVIVDEFGNAFTSINPTGGAGTWASADIDGTTALFGLSCSPGPSAICLAGDQQGNVLWSANPPGGAATWHPTMLDPIATDAVFATACPTSTSCFAADNAGHIWTTLTTTSFPPNWTKVTPFPSMSYHGLMCPSTSLCVLPGSGAGGGEIVIGVPAKPQVVTSNATAVATTTATLNGTVNPRGYTITNCHFDVGTAAPAYGTTVPCAQTVGSGSSPVAVTAAFTGGAPGTTYHFRLVATNAGGGTTQGADETLTTAQPPTVVTQDATAVTTNAPILHGTVDPHGNTITNCHFEAGTSAPAYGTTVPCAETVGGGTGAVAVSAAFTGTAPNTTYHFRLVATNGNGTAQGADKTLTTTQPPVNTQRPVLSGTPIVNSVLSCTTGAWTGNAGNIVYTTVWERAPRSTTADNDPAWLAIGGAAGAQYTVQSDDAGSRVRCHVTRTDDGGIGDAVSTSLRTDAGIPVNVTAPFVSGLPSTRPQDLAQHQLVCNPGTWQNTSDFTYHWTRNTADIPGAIASTYAPIQRRAPGSTSTVNSFGDGGQDIGCRVTATNDLGNASATASNSLRVVDDVPLNVKLPAVQFVRRPAGVSDTDAVATCDEGQWVDGYGIFQTAPYLYRYAWLRNGSPIAGATDHHYTFTDNDLGRDISCQVTDTNPLGDSAPATSAVESIPLPEGPRTAHIYRAGGNNSADPTNLMALSDRYVASINSVVADRLQAAVDTYKANCAKTYNGPKSAADPATVTGFINGIAKCRVFLYDPTRVSITFRGVRYLNGRCTPVDEQVTAAKPACLNMGFKIPAIDPLRPPAADQDVINRVADSTPKQVIWDLNGDGKTDAICPGSAPVLRTILNDGDWKPRAVIVDSISQNSLIYPNAIPDQSFHAGPAGGRAGLRGSQVMVCATSFDPPPNPQTVPCVTSGQIGKVQITGNLCPIDARDIKSADFAALDGDVKELLKLASEHKLYSEGTATARAAQAGPASGTVWVPLTPPTTGAHTRAAVPLQFRDLTAVLDNVAASTSQLGSTTLKKAPTTAATFTKSVTDIGSFHAGKANFALDQIYVANGDGLSLDGISVDPLNGSLALLIPSDVKDGLGAVDAMTLNARDALPQLGPIGDPTSIPLGHPGDAVKETFSDLKTAATDKAKAAAADQLKTLAPNFDELAQHLKDAAGKLDFGPFKLTGAATVTLNDDGTATVKAFAELPGLKLGPATDTGISTDVTLSGDLQGHLHLQGIHFHAGVAYLGGAKLQDLDFTFDDGTLDIKGSIEIPPPASAGIQIKDFSIDKNGPESLDVDYFAGPGGGIPVGPGIYITRLGAGFYRKAQPNANPPIQADTLVGDTTVSVGPSPDGGCPAVGVEADLHTHLAEQFSLDVHGAVEIICVPLINVDFHADQTGLVSLKGGIDWSAGPLFITGTIGGAVRYPAWQIGFAVSGGIRHIPVVGTVKADIKATLSNIGLAVCGSISIFGADIGAGAAERFHNGRPPLTVVELVANLRLFTGCDISEYNSVVTRAVTRDAQPGSSTFTLPAGSKPVLLSFEGAGAAPRVILHGPGGETLDYSDATGDQGKTIGASAGSVIDSEDRTVVILAKPAAGTWTANIADGSTGILRVQKAGILPKPKVTATVSGHGSSRILRYNVATITGQSVRFVEQGKGGQTILKTVKGGGKGSVRFTVSEATSPKRTIEAQVLQDGTPRANLTVAHFSAPSPRVGKPPHVRVRRSGSTAIVTWGKAPLAKAYEVSVTYGVGRAVLIDPKRGSLRVVVKRVLKGEGLRVAVVAFSAAGHRSKVAKATLAGNMRVGAKVKKKATAKKKVTAKKKPAAKKHR